MDSGPLEKQLDLGEHDEPPQSQAGKHEIHSVNPINVATPMPPAYHLGIVFTIPKNGDDLGMVYGIGFTT